MSFKCTSTNRAIILLRITQNVNCLITTSAPSLHMMQCKMFLRKSKLKVTYIYSASKDLHHSQKSPSIYLEYFSVIFEIHISLTVLIFTSVHELS